MSLQEMLNEQHEEQERIRKQHLKLKSFELAKGLKTDIGFGKQADQTVDELIKDAEKIYQELLACLIDNSNNGRIIPSGIPVMDNSNAFQDWLKSQCIDFERSGHQTIILGENDMFEIGRAWGTHKTNHQTASEAKTPKN